MGIIQRRVTSNQGASAASTPRATGFPLFPLRPDPGRELNEGARRLLFTRLGPGLVVNVALSTGRFAASGAGWVTRLKEGEFEAETTIPAAKRSQIYTSGFDAAHTTEPSRTSLIHVPS